MSEHTPTKWRLDGNEIYGDDPKGFPRRVAVALLYMGSEDAELAEANAAYIVQAVNAHKRLRDFVWEVAREGPISLMGQALDLIEELKL